MKTLKQKYKRANKLIKILKREMSPTLYKKLHFEWGRDGKLYVATYPIRECIYVCPLSASWRSVLSKLVVMMP